jgi:hypothetical protein
MHASGRDARRRLEWGLAGDMGRRCVPSAVQGGRRHRARGRQRGQPSGPRGANEKRWIYVLFSLEQSVRNLILDLITILLSCFVLPWLGPPHVTF